MIPELCHSSGCESCHLRSLFMVAWVSALTLPDPDVKIFSTEISSLVLYFLDHQNSALKQEAQIYQHAEDLRAAICT